MTIPRTLSSCVMVAVAAIASMFSLGADHPDVRVTADSVGPRTLEQQTKAAVVRDYLRAWQTMNNALGDNRADLLNDSFAGLAREKLANTIHEQQALDIRTTYRDRSHDLKIVYNSPEGLSIQLIDDVQYDVVVHRNGQTLGPEPVRSRYVVVMTPTESTWKVRIFQSGRG